eukprot:1147670-Pyramimonas_sp.AAC.1
MDLDPPTPYSQYLGCGQQAYDVQQNVFDTRMSTIRPMLPAHSDKAYHTAKQDRGIRHDMLGVTDQCIERYLECASKRTHGTGSR